MELVIELPRLFNYSCHHCLQKPVGDVGGFFSQSLSWCFKGRCDVPGVDLMKLHIHWLMAC